jgi:hypothetical protein
MDPPGWMQGWRALIVSLLDTNFGPVTGTNDRRAQD